MYHTRTLSPAPRRREHSQVVSTAVLLTAILFAGFVLRIAALTADRFHADEALYAGWALRILDDDPLLLGVPVDKPPLYLYTLAGAMGVFGPSEVAARLPNLAASMLGIALTFRLGSTLYGLRTGIWAAVFVALSPFDILFARTAFTDPMLVLWMLCALYAVARGRWLWAGIWLGLAQATKQHGALLIPLVVLVGEVLLFHSGVRRGRLPAFGRRLAIGALGFALPYGLVVAWDSARWAIRPGYWTQSTMSYGGLAWAPVIEWGERLMEWLSWARYLTGSPVLNVLLLLGVAGLLLHGWRRHRGAQETTLDQALVTYGLGYLLFHTVLRFSVWDRYLLPLVPVVALLGARVVAQGERGLTQIAGRGDRAGRFLRGVRSACVLIIVLSAAIAGSKGALNGYPVGGEHWAYQGLDEVAAYLKQNAPEDAVLYHHWLLWHYTYYLHDADLELRWWESGEHLRREALRTPDREQYIVLPDWRTMEPEASGVRLQPIYEARRQDGSVSLQLCRIELEK